MGVVRLRDRYKNCKYISCPKRHFSTFFNSGCLLGVFVIELCHPWSGNILIWDLLVHWAMKIV